MSEQRKPAVPAENVAAVSPRGSADAQLSVRDRSILDFERNWKRHAEAKEDAIQSEFGLTFARYYQVLNRIIDSPAALAHDPMLVKRLQRMRETRSSARTLMPHPSDDTSRPL